MSLEGKMLAALRGRELGCPGAQGRLIDEVRCKKTLLKLYFRAWLTVWFTNIENLEYCSSYHMVLSNAL